MQKQKTPWLNKNSLERTYQNFQHFFGVFINLNDVLLNGWDLSGRITVFTISKILLISLWNSFTLVYYIVKKKFFCNLKKFYSLRIFLGFLQSLFLFNCRSCNCMYHHSIFYLLFKYHSWVCIFYGIGQFVSKESAFKHNWVNSKLVCLYSNGDYKLT